jgi:hypothetical protein
LGDWSQSFKDRRLRDGCVGSGDTLRDTPGDGD